MRYFIFSFICCFMLTGAVFADDQAVKSGGHYTVTSPEDCTAQLTDDNSTRPALHYMTHSYKRCVEMSRKLIHQKMQESNKDTQDINKDALSYEEPILKPKNYYRVTPRHKENKDE